MDGPTPYTLTKRLHLTHETRKERELLLLKVATLRMHCGDIASRLIPPFSETEFKTARDRLKIENVMNSLQPAQAALVREQDRLRAEAVRLRGLLRDLGVTGPEDK